MAKPRAAVDVAQAPKIDPVTLEVVRAGLTSIISEMSITLNRTSYSTILREINDYSCVLFDNQGRLLAQAEGIPIFNGSMNFVIDAVIEKYPLAEMKAGDIFLSNDPYMAGGTHKNDVNVVMPLFWEGELVMLAANKAHHLDIGGKDPGSWSADARNTYQEGICLPAVKLASGGVMNEAVIEILMANLRTPELSRGDFAAQIAALKTAEIRVNEWLGKHGVALLKGATEELLDHGERIVRAAIERIPDGVYKASGFADGDAVTDEPIPMAVTVRVEGSDIHIDFTGSGEQREGSAGNCHWVVTVSMTRQTIMFFTDTALGGNEGSYRPIHVTAPPGSVFKPQYPAPVTTGMGNMGTRLIELILQALADVLPEEVIAGTFGCFSCMTLGGTDPETGGEFVHFECYSGGWGGRAEGDGNSATVSLGSGNAYNIPVEVMETTTPILMCEKFALQERSAGAGRHRGGFGTEIDYRLMGSAELAIALDRERFRPYGLFGGGEGQGSELLVDPGEPGERRYLRASGVKVPEGTLVRHRTSGGGGYGDPKERAPELVAEDCRNGLITLEDAREFYGVVLEPRSCALDEAATARLRGTG
jgi:N-methylhydantoinase B